MRFERGNEAAMRDALLNIQEYAAAMDVDDGNVLAILDACRDALSAPARNCDVGTAEEQTKRLRENCFNKYKPSCKGCKYITDLKKENCWLKWAQMPYEEEGGAK